MKAIGLFLLSIFLGWNSASAEDKYQITVNLVKVKADRVKVEIDLPTVKEGTVEYIMPSVIPGSYSKKDFGRFISNITCLDQRGKKLNFIRKGPNVIQINRAQGLDKIVYWVDDTWDADVENFIFQPGGTNIEKDKNFVINHQGFYGYLEGYKMMPYEITYIKPSSMWGETPLQIERGEKSDKVFAKNYVQLVDNPVMFCKPDTASLMAGNMKVNISVYSHTGSVTSEQIREYISPTAKALESFFGTLPVDHYHFIMYFPRFNSDVAKAGGFGALEHSYCSFYFLPELRDEIQLKEMVEGVAAHEFLHILTPLNVHSEEIEDFDFRNPKMSQHLWMYEGVTEYFSNLIQVQSGLMTYEKFQEEMMGKIRAAHKFIKKNDGEPYSFTKMSAGILTSEYKELYSDVYQKGCVVGLLLDIRLRELSGGEKGLREVMMELAGRYGPNKPFKDDELIDEIVEITYPEIRQFFDDYVIGNKPLPYEEYLGKIGWKYYDLFENTVYTFGKLGFDQGAGNQLEIVRISRKYNPLQLKTGDVIVSVNGVAVKAEADEALGVLLQPSTDTKVTVVIRRDGKERTVSAAPDTKTVKKRRYVTDVTNPSEVQLTLRKSVIGQ